MVLVAGIIIGIIFMMALSGSSSGKKVKAAPVLAHGNGRVKKVQQKVLLLLL